MIWICNYILPMICKFRSLEMLEYLGTRVFEVVMQEHICITSNIVIVNRSTLLVICSLSTALYTVDATEWPSSDRIRGLHWGSNGYRFARFLIANRSAVWFSGIIGKTICWRPELERASPRDPLLPPSPSPMYMYTANCNLNPTIKFSDATRRLPLPESHSCGNRGSL